MKENRSDIVLIQISRSPEDYMILTERVQQGNGFVLVHQDFVDALLSKYHRFIDRTGLFLFYLLSGEGAYPCSPTVHCSHNFLITLNCQFISHLNRLKNIRARSVSRREEAKTQNVLLLREHFWARSNEAVPASLFIRGPLSRAYTKKTGWSGDDRPSTQGISSRMNRHIGSMRVITTNEIPAVAHCAIVDNTIPVSLPGKSALLIMKERGSVSSPQYPDKVYAKAEEAVRFDIGNIQGGHSLREKLHSLKTAKQKTQGPMLRKGRRIPPAESKTENQTELSIIQPVGPRSYYPLLPLLNRIPHFQSSLSDTRSVPAVLSELTFNRVEYAEEKRLLPLTEHDNLRFPQPQLAEDDFADIAGVMPSCATLRSEVATKNSYSLFSGILMHRLPASSRMESSRDGGERDHHGLTWMLAGRHALPNYTEDPGRPDIPLLKPTRTAARQDVPSLTHSPKEAARESTGNTRHVDRKTETIAVKTTLGPVVTQQPDVHQTNPIDVQQIANRVYGLLVDRITRERKMRGALRR